MSLPHKRVAIVAFRTPFRSNGRGKWVSTTQYVIHRRDGDTGCCSWIDPTTLCEGEPVERFSGPGSWARIRTDKAESRKDE